MASITISVPGSYSLAVTDSIGCGARSAPYIVLSIDDNSTPSDIAVYPNPNSSGTWLVMANSQYETAAWQIFDMDGKEVYSGKLQGTVTTVQTGLAAGTYLMRVTNGANTGYLKLVQY